MIHLTTTIYRKVKIGGKDYVIGLHPAESDPLFSIRQLGRRTPYALHVSTVRVHAALAYGRAEQAAKREARKAGVKWRFARRKFTANLLPPDRKRRRKID